MSGDAYTGLDDAQLVQLSLGLSTRTKPKIMHDYIETIRGLIDGEDVVDIPDSHAALHVGVNHEGGVRLNVRVRQGASWLGKADTHFTVTPGSPEFGRQAEMMERFARFGEKRLSRGKMLHRSKNETMRDIFECGVSIVQHHPHRGFYIKAQQDHTLMMKGARIGELFFRRRIDPLYYDWDEDVEGEIGAGQIRGRREISEIARVLDVSAFDKIKGAFPWAESLNESRFGSSGESIETKEIWTPDRGAIILTGESKTMNADDPARVISSWRNLFGRVPHYIAAASPWPWTSPLDEMIQLTNLRNYWATMHDYQAAGAIFRHWQLVDTNTGQDVPVSLWKQPVPEHLLLDMSKPPPYMGAGTEWKLAPFEMNDVIPRLQMIVAQHEDAGASVARLIGHAINANTAVGTADQMEDYARGEFADIIEAVEDQRSMMWEDSFRYIAKVHKKEPVLASARMMSLKTGRFFQTTLEIRGEDVVSEDIGVQLDTRSRLAKIADYRYGREARTNGDMSFGRAVELGLVPGVDDAVAEKQDIFVDQIENILYETQIINFQREAAQNMGLTDPAAAPAPPNITRGARTDPRGTGTGQGPDNVSNTALSPGGSDVLRSA